MNVVSKSLPLQKILGKSTFTKLNNTFADVRGSLTKVEGTARDLGAASSFLRQADLRSKQLDYNLSKAGIKIKELRNKEVEDAKDAADASGTGTISEKTKDSESKFSKFFNIRGDKDKQPETNNTRKNLLNDTIGKIFDGKNKKSKNIDTIIAESSNQPPSTSFFDKNGISDQINNFAGGSLGESLDIA
jgi:hypothetical protein